MAGGGDAGKTVKEVFPREFWEGCVFMKYVLTTEVAAKILQMRVGVMPEVCQLAMDCNWGAPVSGRFDTDYCAIWAAAKCAKDAKVYIYGRHGGSAAWDIKTEMIPEGELLNGYCLFKKELSSQFEFPEEYVILLEKDGQPYYDNNAGRNYYVKPYYGHTASFICDGSTFYDFNDNRPYKMIGV